MLLLVVALVKLHGIPFWSSLFILLYSSNNQYWIGIRHAPFFEAFVSPPFAFRDFFCPSSWLQAFQQHLTCTIKGPILILMEPWNICGLVEFLLLKIWTSSNFSLNMVCYLLCCPVFVPYRKECTWTWLGMSSQLWSWHSHHLAKKNKKSWSKNSV